MYRDQRGILKTIAQSGHLIIIMYYSNILSSSVFYLRSTTYTDIVIKFSNKWQRFKTIHLHKNIFKLKNK